MANRTPEEIAELKRDILWEMAYEGLAAEGAAVPSANRQYQRARYLKMDIHDQRMDLQRKYKQDLQKAKTPQEKAKLKAAFDKRHATLKAREVKVRGLAKQARMNRNI